jgi:alpha-glucan, water dikinase
MDPLEQQGVTTTQAVTTRGGLTLVARTCWRETEAELTLEAPPGSRFTLHWGLRRHQAQGWSLPPQTAWPPGSVAFGQSAVQTPLAPADGRAALVIRLGPAADWAALEFVLFFPGEGRWDNNGGRNYQIRLATPAPQGGAALSGPGQHTDVADEIVRAETTHHSWTLMHRFNLCHDLLERVRGSLDGQALIYVYLRFSAIRQLTWQRNYNTKPRELAHAQERFTQKLTEVYRTEPGSRSLARLTLATVGPGGEGQRIRDEILNIMHRHHVKETTGHFLEEWHQKLHNNTTPDDLVICEAYLAFLRNNGSLDAFYRTLEAGGVTRQRLESFERPIRTQPDFVPHLKDGLLHDFQNFLRVLKASHAGTDLETALNTARGQLDGDLQGALNYLWEHRNERGDRFLELVRQITEVRRRLSGLFGRSHGLRELLYLDLALEQLLRAAVEQNIHLQLSGDQLVELIGWVLENVLLSYEEPELAACSRHWQRLKSLPRFGPVWSLHAKSVVDRVARALSGWIDHFYQLLQPKAEYLGRGFGAEPWTITLFSEEVVRGSSLGFALSILLRHLDPLLRQAARLGNWQIISHGRGAGQVEVVEVLRSIQGRRFEAPRVVVADKVTGEEEVPEGVTAVIVPDVVDLVSHMAVRARNSRLLLASCHDPALLERLKALRGRYVELEVSPAGDVIAVESTPGQPRPAHAKRATPLNLAARPFTRYAIPLGDFDEDVVGGKAWRQKQLRSRLPDWIRLPASAALPFGVAERVLGLELNRDLAARYADGAREAAQGDSRSLAALRETVLALAAPEDLQQALREAMAAAGLAWPEDWAAAWACIKRVWASKWNERAFLSRQRAGLPHEALCMSVLIQQVVPADYAFVLHTVNPSNGSRGELFGEVVLGLGETLVGNYPGRALSFVCRKTTGEQSLGSFPSKSVGLYGDGLIFRSDSNGEDLAGYAGAGLYQSVLLQPARRVDLDYTQAPLLWDEAFRQNLLAGISRVGLEVERATGAPQDIEGAVVGGNYYVVQTRPQVGLE